MKIVNKQKINDEYEISIFNKPILQYGKIEQKEYKENYIEIFPKSFEFKVLDKILKSTGTQHDYIFFIRAGLGEAYLLNFMIDEIIKKENIKNPCFVCHRKQYEDLFKLYHPEIPFYHINIDTKSIFPVLKNRKVKYKKHTFNINPSTLKEIQTILRNYEKGIETRSYVDVIKSFNNIEKFNYIKPVFGNEIKNSVEKKIKPLNMNNFIFIINEANFINPIKQEFWEDIISKLKAKGYDIFINNPAFSLDEVFYLATYAKAIIGLRCGFSELLSTIDIPKYIICTDCKYHDIKNLHVILSLKTYPFVNSKSIFEYSTLKQPIESIKTEILEEIL